MSELQPCVLVAATSMEEIEDRVALLALAVAWRSVDAEPSVCLVAFRMIPCLRYVSVRNIPYQVVVCWPVRYIENAEYKTRLVSKCIIAVNTATKFTYMPIDATYRYIWWNQFAKSLVSRSWLS